MAALAPGLFFTAGEPTEAGLGFAGTAKVGAGAGTGFGAAGASLASADTASGTAAGFGDVLSVLLTLISRLNLFEIYCLFLHNHKHKHQLKGAATLPTTPRPPNDTPMGRPVLSRPFATMRTITALMLREMTSTYGRSPGGYVWAILEPLGVITLMAICFSFLVNNPSLGTSFILFYATGYLPFMLYQSISVTVARAFHFSKPLLYYPSVTWVDSIIARFTLNTLTQIMAGFILLAAIILSSDTRTILDIGPILFALFLAASLGLGVGCINCLLMGLFPVWAQIWSIATRPLFIISGVFFLYEDMPTLVQGILWYNPLIHITGLFRQGMYSLYEPTYVSPFFVLGLAMVCLAMGLLLLRRYHKDILASL